MKFHKRVGVPYAHGRGRWSLGKVSLPDSEIVRVSSARTAMTECHRLTAVLRAGSPRSGRWPIWFLERAVSSLSPSSHGVVTWPFPCARAWGTHRGGTLPSLLRSLILSAPVPTLVTSSDLRHFLRGPVSRGGHTAVRASACDFGGEVGSTDIQATTARKCGFMF